VDDLKNVRMVSSAPDYDGDGNVEEGMYYEIQGLQETLMAEITKYAADKGGAEIKYDAATYPYFMGADGKAYPSWTPRLLKAAYNYQVSIKDPGAFAHGNKYIVQLLFDSIADLGGDTSTLPAPMRDTSLATPCPSAIGISMQMATPTTQCLSVV
jgi:hypothetical protein